MHRAARGRRERRKKWLLKRSRARSSRQSSAGASGSSWWRRWGPSTTRTRTCRGRSTYPTPRWTSWRLRCCRTSRPRSSCTAPTGRARTRRRRRDASTRWGTRTSTTTRKASRTGSRRGCPPRAAPPGWPARGLGTALGEGHGHERSAGVSGAVARLLCPTLRRALRALRRRPGGEQPPSPAYLSLEAVHRRGWGSLYAALSKGEVDEGALRGLLARRTHVSGGSAPYVYALDVSPWPRCDAEASPDRSYLYHPSRHSAGRPIVAGWGYHL